MDKKIIEGNKLIAEFMGGKFKKGIKKKYTNDRFYDLKDKGYYYDVSELQYHTSWDWLMPVVEKIEWLDSKDVDSRITIERQECRIYFDNGNEKYERLMGSRPKIETVWLSVVSFIQWYNSQSKPNNQ